MAIGDGVARIKPDRVGEVADGALMLPSVERGPTPVHEGGRIGRIQTEGVTEVGDRLDLLAQADERPTAIAVGSDGLGVPSQSLREVGDGLGVLPLLELDGAAVVVSDGRVGIEAEGGREVGERPVQVALSRPRRPSSHEVLGRARRWPVFRSPSREEQEDEGKPGETKRILHGASSQLVE